MNEASRQFLADLQGKLTQYFSGEEIETLAFILGVDYDSLRGGTKPTKVNSLIYDLARNGRLDQLLLETKKQRAHVEWPDFPADFTLPQGTAGSEADGLTVYQIQNLNTSGGAFIGGGVTAGGDVDAGQKSVAGDEIKGSKYVMSGDFRGAVLNIESRLDNVTQTVGASPSMQPNQREELERLMADLKTALSRVPPEHVGAAETLARRVDALAEEATAEQPDQDTITDLGDITRRAAAKLADVVPGITRVVALIVEIVASIAV